MDFLCYPISKGAFPKPTEDLLEPLGFRPLNLFDASQGDVRAEFELGWFRSKCAAGIQHRFIKQRHLVRSILQPNPQDSWEAFLRKKSNTCRLQPEWLEIQAGFSKAGLQILNASTLDLAQEPQGKVKLLALSPSRQVCRQ